MKPDVIAVVAYGRILPQVVLDIPPKGCINIHASLLPALRGSGPVQWAVLPGTGRDGGHSDVYGSGDGCRGHDRHPKDPR